MLELLQRREEQRAKWLEMATAYAERLREGLGKVTAIVYGSVARGDYGLGSDVDMLIVSEQLPGHLLARMELLYSCLEGPLEPRGYTLTEFRTLQAKGHPFLNTVLSEGIAVTDDLGLVKEEEGKHEGRRRKA